MKLIHSTTLAIAMFTAVTASTAAAETKLTARQQRKIDELIHVYTQGNSLALLKSAADITQRADQDQLVAMDDYVRERDVPPIQELLADTRLKLVFQGQAKNLPKPTQQETLLTIPRIDAIITAAVDAMNDHAIMRNPLPSFVSLDEYERLFWDIHVLQNKLRNAYNTAKYGNEMVDYLQRFKPDSMTAEQQAIAQTDFAGHLATLPKKSQDIEERKTELRLDRLQLAGELLHDSTDFRPRFTAASVVDLDGDLLAAFLKENQQGQFSRERLNEPELAQTVGEEVALLRKEAGELIAKSRLFYTGLHWWQRGRYGRGSDGHGMLKSIGAIKSPAAAFGLFMPSETPVPTDPYEVGDDQIPEIDRRHYYVWMYEYRQIESQVSRRTDKLRTKSPTSVTKFDYFW